MSDWHARSITSEQLEIGEKTGSGNRPPVPAAAAEGGAQAAGGHSMALSPRAWAGEHPAPQALRCSTAPPPQLACAGDPPCGHFAFCFSTAAKLLYLAAQEWLFLN